MSRGVGAAPLLYQPEVNVSRDPDLSPFDKFLAREGITLLANEGIKEVAWGSGINDTLLAIDRWFAFHGHAIPEPQRVELEGHLRKLSEQVAGYPTFLSATWGQEGHQYRVSEDERLLRAPTGPAIPVYPFCFDGLTASEEEGLRERAAVRRSTVMPGFIGAVAGLILISIILIGAALGWHGFEYLIAGAGQ